MRDDGSFDERVAARYDETYDYQAVPDVIEPVLDLLAELAGEGRALELGIGTGRIALPLAQRGVQIHGIELSRAMAARLKANPGSDAVGVTIRDFSTARVDGSFRLAYVLVNTIMNLTSQEAQVPASATWRRISSRVGISSSRSSCLSSSGFRRAIPIGCSAPSSALGHRRVRRGTAGPDLAPLPGGRRWSRASLDPVPLRLAE